MTDHADQELRLRLKGWRRDVAPSVDLWPAIATRLQERPKKATSASRRRLPRWAPIGMAASMLLAIGFTWKLGIDGQPPPVIRGEAVAMAADYQAALEEYAETPLQPELQPALEFLDQNAASILAAIERYPDARFLLDQLRRTYDRRLELTQRAIITT